MTWCTLWNFTFLWMLFELCYAKGPPRITSRVSNRHVVQEGNTIKLPCPVHGDPPPFLQWTKDEETIHRGWTRYKMLSHGLRIKELEMEDTGVYVCKATNGFGSVNIQFQLFVIDANGTVTPPMVPQEGNLYPQTPDEAQQQSGTMPRFSQPNKMRKHNVQRPVGSSVRFKCKATAKPKPTVVWFKDNQVLTDDDIGQSKHPRWTLKLRHLEREDSGRYTCRVHNRVGAINFTYTLDVIEKIKAKPELVPPHPVNTTVPYGESALFQCKVKSAVHPHIQWLKRVDSPAELGHTNTTITVKGQKFVVLKTGHVLSRGGGSYLNKLLIKNAKAKDSGMYICLGANSMGYSFRSAFLTVLPSPHAKRQAPVSSGLPPLALIIAVPVAILLIVVILAIYLIQRKKRCTRQKPLTVNMKQQQQPKIAPPMDRDQFSPLPPIQTQMHMHMQAPSRERIMMNYPDLHSNYPDLHSDISSLPRMQPHQHAHYGC